MHYNVGADLFTYVAPSSHSVFAVQDGFIEATTLPGIGFEVDEAKVREADHLAKIAKGEGKGKGEGGQGRDGGIKAWRNAVWKGPDGSLREW